MRPLFTRERSGFKGLFFYMQIHRVGFIWCTETEVYLALKSILQVVFCKIAVPHLWKQSLIESIIDKVTGFLSIATPPLQVFFKDFNHTSNTAI